MSGIAFGRTVTIHWADAVARVPLDVVARDAGYNVEQVADALAELVQAGFLTPRPDGDYDATSPHGVRRR